MLGSVYHLDVELSFPGGEESPKGRTVRPLNSLHDLSSDRGDAGQFLSINYTLNIISQVRK